MTGKSNKIFFQFPRRRIIQAGLGAIISSLMVNRALASTDPYYDDVAARNRGILPPDDGATIIQDLSQIPYTSEGSGPPVYILMSRTCSVCEMIWQDHKKYPLSVELRWIPVPYPQDGEDETAQVVFSRTTAVFDSYMAGTLPDNDFTQDNEKVSIFNNFNDTIQNAVNLASNDGTSGGTPTIFWERHGVVEWMQGYGDGFLPDLMKHVNS